MSSKKGLSSALVILASLIGVLLFLGWLGGKTAVHATPISPDRLLTGNNIIYVNHAAGGLNDGTDWTNAYTDLQLALTSAISGTEIWVAQGVYTPGTQITNSFALTDGVQLYGGFAATETVRTERDWQTNITVLSGDIEGNDTTDPNGIVTDTANITGTNAYHVVIAKGVGETAVLDGFSITAGFASVASQGCTNPVVDDRCGGGLYLVNSDAGVSNVTFIGNQAWYYGAGLYARNGAPVLTNVDFVNNTSTNGSGGGASFSGSTLQMTDSSFTGNSSGRGGGGVYIFQGSLEIQNLTIHSNTSGTVGNFDGGGINIGYASGTISQATIYRNTTNGGGGGAYLYHNTLLLEEISFTENTANKDGGGLNTTNDDSTYLNIIFEGNVTNIDGGGASICCNDGSAQLINVLFVGNYAGQDGGGLHGYNASPVNVTNATFAYNHANLDGGGLQAHIGGPSMHNAILWGNTADGQGDQVQESGSGLPTLTDGLIQGGCTGHVDCFGTILTSEPLFTSLPSSGDGDWTTWADNDYGDLRLGVFSPAIDVGDEAHDPDANNSPPDSMHDIATDLAGLPRIADGDGDSLHEIDLGAYEASAMCYVETTGDNTTDYVSADASALQDAINAASPNDWLKIAGTCAGVSETVGMTQTLYITNSVTLEGGYAYTDWFNNNPGVTYATLDALNAGRVVVVASGVDLTMRSLKTANGDGFSGGGGNDFTGGIRINSGATLDLRDSFVIGNISQRGGGINNAGVLTVTDSLIAENSSTAWAGGVFNTGVVTVRNSTIEENSGEGSGLFNNGSGAMLIENTTIANNLTVNSGGGIQNRGVLTVTHSTISSNSIDGINNFSGNAVATIHHSTIVSHTQAGVANNGSTQVLNLAHTLVANNGTWDCRNTAGGAVNDGGYNLVEDGTCITEPTSISGDPDIAPLAHNGGDTLTHELNAGSPAIDAGDPAYPFMLGDYDQRGAGFPRVAGGRIDIGALEQATVACFVETNGDNVTDDSSVDATAVQDAVDAASAGALIKVAGSCAGVNFTNGISQTVYIDKSLTLQGGYDESDWFNYDPDTNVTILNAQQQGRTAVITGTIDVTLDGLTITGGGNLTNIPGHQDDGAGIWTNSTLTLSHSAVISNMITLNAGDDGAGIYIENGTLTIADSLIAHNENQDDDGAGIYATASIVSLERTTVENNRSTVDGNHGGGIKLDNGTHLWVEDSQFLENVLLPASAQGAAIYGSGSYITVTNSLFEGNETFGTSGNGGTIYHFEGQTTIENSAIQNNHTYGSSALGGGISQSSGTLTVRNSVILSNTTTRGEGGGIFVSGDAQTFIQDSTIAYNQSFDPARPGGGLATNQFGGNDKHITLENVTFSGNSSTSVGGAIWLPRGFLTMTHVTLSDNSAITSTGGISVGVNGTVNMVNSIIANSTGEDCLSAGTLNDGGYNLVEDGNCISAGTSQSGDPNLDVLANYGGDTLTHALLAGSPAIDYIPNGMNGCGTMMMTDQRGFDRPSFLSPSCDVGALETPNCTGFPMIVGNEEELNIAIYCFNKITEAGTYTMNLTANIALTASTLPVDNPIAGVSLVMDGGMSGADINGFGASGIRPLEIKNAESVHLIHIAPTGGNVTGNGGGVLIDSVPVTLTSSILYTNTATGNGGGLWTNAPLVLEDNSSVFDNVANNGGGLFLNTGTAVLTVDSTYFGQNRATNNGGAINHNGSNAGNVISASLFENNAANNGGALQTGKNLAISSSSFLSNTAVNDGGALKFTNGKAPVEHSLFVGNTADDGGAIFIDANAKLEMSNSTLSGNTAAAGGGMYFNETYESSFVRFTTLYGNVATIGGGMYVSGGTHPLAAGESAAGGGDGVYLRSSIIAGSIGGDCADPDGEFNDDTYNLIEDGSCINEPTSLSGDPLLGPLADHGGPVIWGQPTLTHALLPGSPALDYVPDGVVGCGGQYVTDQRGFTRPFDTLCDLGAFELNVNYAPIAADDLYTTTEEITLTVPISLGVLLNDVDGDWDVITAVLSTTTPLGNLALNSDGSFTYLPNANFCGTDSFTYAASDGEDDSAAATVTITVTCVNDVPVAVEDSYIGVEDTVLTVPADGVLLNDVDVDGDVLSATLQMDVVTGTLSLSNDGGFVYTPTLNWFGVVTFTYQADDGLVSSETAVVTLTILSENDPPVVNAGSDQSVNEGHLVQFNGTYVDPGQQLIEGGTDIQWDFGDGNTASGTLTPTHSYGDNGVYTVTLTITDTGGAAMSDTLLVTVANVAPELSALPNQSVLVGMVVSFTAVFTDPGILDTHTAVIDWGDGSNEAGTVGQSAMTVSGSHLYASEGVYTVTVTVIDDDNGLTNQTFLVTVGSNNIVIYLPFMTKP